MSMFHLVQFSLWPLTSAIGALTLTVGIVFWFCYNSLLIVIMANILIFFSAILWWRDVTRESNGHHTTQVVTGFKFGMILFILSEVMFFFSFFWAFFSSSGAPTIEVGSCWPPIGITVINAFQVPLLNTLVLLTSGMTVTWSHHCILNKNFKEGLFSLFLTILLGVYFTMLQLAEYSEASFSISDSVYGTTFFVTTGFHGLHVMIGTTFLIVNLIRYSMNHFSSNHHFGFEAAAWYWHFVDVVWLFLFVCVYWWGS